MIDKEFEKITQTDLNQITEGPDSDEYDEILCKRKIFVRCIADHIAGMTDSYAMNEYHRLYGL